MKTVDQLQTIAHTYQEIYQDERAWTALGNFMNDWFDYASDRREQLVAESIIVPENAESNMLRWAAFCAASVEYLCERYNVPCPSWVFDPTYHLSEPWFYSLAANRFEIRTRLIEQTPEPFTRRNIYCGNRMFDNKYEFVERYHRLVIEQQSDVEIV